MPEKGDIEDTGNCQTERRHDPDDEGVEHAEQDDRSDVVAVVQDLDVSEELADLGAIVARRVLAGRNEIGLHDRVQGHGVDDVARTLGEDDAQPGFEGKVGEEGDVLAAFLALGQFGEEEKSAPSSTGLAHAHTLRAECQWVQIALGDSTGPDCPDSAHPSNEEQHPGQNDASGEYPARDGEGDHRLYLAVPAIEDQEVDRRKDVDRVAGQRDQKGDVEDAVRKVGEAGGGSKI